VHSSWNLEYPARTDLTDSVQLRQPNRVTSKTDPLSNVDSYLYDDIGNRTRVADRAEVPGRPWNIVGRESA
jgi:hypothetical protein